MAEEKTIHKTSAIAKRQMLKMPMRTPTMLILR